MGACYSVSFWFSAFCSALLPTSVGYQDLAALLARQSHITERQHEHLIASPFGTIEPATFSYTRPIGTAMPAPLYQLVNFDPRSNDSDTWRNEPLTAEPATQIAYPTVNRRLKGDRLPTIKTAPGSAAPQSLPQLSPISVPAAKEPAPPAQLSPPPVLRLKRAEQYGSVPPIATPAHPLPIAPALPHVVNDSDVAPTIVSANSGANHQALPSSALHEDGAVGLGGSDDSAVSDKPPELPPASAKTAPSAGYPSAQIYFGEGVMGFATGLESWAPGAGPITASPFESGVKFAALEGYVDDLDNGGETIAKENDASLLESPSQRLKLSGASRVRAEKCLADAVYFEARGEPQRGQEAVAQVVMNRVFSGFYPNNVCGVVYQNANRYLACQFTFACEGRNLNRIEEPDMWEQAKRIAKDTLDGKIWLPEVSHATHYHAFWVHPSWVHEMTKLYKLGVHTFYRPRAWGNGNGEPVWGPAPQISKAGHDTGKAQAASMSYEAVTQAPDSGVLLPEPL